MKASFGDALSHHRNARSRCEDKGEKADLRTKGQQWITRTTTATDKKTAMDNKNNNNGHGRKKTYKNQSETRGN